MDNDLVYYLAGPMTGIPQFNFPKFRSVATELRMQGFHVISPAEMDDKEQLAAALDSETGELNPDGTTANGDTWGDFLSRDIKIVADHVDALILLRDWYKSKGARTEAFVAMNLGKPLFTYLPEVGIQDLIPLSRGQAMRLINMELSDAYYGQAAA
jgi:hypothetical protein